MSHSGKVISLWLIHFYQFFLSGIFGGTCRFQPSCSNYARDAFEKWPPHKAFALTVRRLLKCHPFGSSGYDPVPEAKGD